MIPFRKSLAFRVLVMTFILLPLPLLVDAFIYLQGRYREGIEETKTRLTLESKVVLFLVSRQVKAKHQAIQIIEDYLDLKNNFPQEPSLEIDQNLQNLANEGKFAALALFKEQANSFSIVSSNLQDSDAKASLQNLVNTLLIEDEFSLLHRFKDHYFFVYGRKIFSPDGHTLKGALVYSNDITTNLQEDLQDRLSLFGAKSHFALLDKNLIIIFSLDKDFEFQYLFPLSKKEMKAFEKVNPDLRSQLQDLPVTISFNQGNPFINFKWRNKNWLGTIQPVPETKFFLLTYISQKQLFFPQLKNILALYGVYLLILILGGILSYLATLRVAKPLKNLSVTMESIQKGDLNVRYKKDPLGFEINFLGLTFNNMIDSLLEKQSLAEEERVKTERYNKELLIGQQIQRSLLPEEMPHFAGVSLEARYLPAKDVGGDFYDIFKRNLDDDELVLVVADASGKGVGACFYSLGVRSYLRTFSHHEKKVSNILEKSNLLFTPECGDTGMFVTVFLAIYNPKNKVLSWGSCGHPPMFVRRKDGSIQTLSERAMALGVDESLKVNSQQIQLFADDLVFLYSDGATDDQNEKGELYSEERLLNFVKEKGHLSVSQIANELIEELKNYQGKALQYDDITLLLMRVL